MSSPTPVFEATDAVVQSLIASWDDYANQSAITTKGKQMPQIILGLGLATHVHRLAGPAFDMLRQGLVLEAVPTLRAMFEAAVTAHCAVQVPDAAKRVCAQRPPPADEIARRDGRHEPRLLQHT